MAHPGLQCARQRQHYTQRLRLGLNRLIAGRSKVGADLAVAADHHEDSRSAEAQLIRRQGNVLGALLEELQDVDVVQPQGDELANLINGKLGRRGWGRATEGLPGQGGERDGDEDDGESEGGNHAA